MTDATTARRAPHDISHRDAADGRSPDASPWQRLMALSGVAFAPLFVVGWLTSAVSNSPNYTAADQKWINWAHDDHIKGRISSFALVLAASSSSTSWEPFGARSKRRSPRFGARRSLRVSRSPVL